MSVPSSHADRLAKMPRRKASVDVLGSTTRYWEYGPEDAEHTVVIAHGYRGDHHGLQRVIVELPDIRWVSPDLPGMGDSTAMTGAPHSIAGYARWLTAFVETLGLRGRAILLGHSFGSMVTTRAIADGLETPGLILVNPISTNPREGAHWLPTLGTRALYGAADRLRTPRHEGFAQALLANRAVVGIVNAALIKTEDRELRQWIREEHGRHFNSFSDVGTIAEAFRASLSTQVGDAAADIHVPVIMIAGRRDMVTPVDGQERTRALFPDADLKIIEGVGHLIHYEKPGEAAGYIREFVTTRLPSVR